MDRRACRHCFRLPPPRTGPSGHRGASARGSPRCPSPVGRGRQADRRRYPRVLPPLSTNYAGILSDTSVNRQFPWIASATQLSGLRSLTISGVSRRSTPEHRPGSPSRHPQPPHRRRRERGDDRGLDRGVGCQSGALWPRAWLRVLAGGLGLDSRTAAASGARRRERPHLGRRRERPPLRRRGDEGGGRRMAWRQSDAFDLDSDCVALRARDQAGATSFPDSTGLNPPG